MKQQTAVTIDADAPVAVVRAANALLRFRAAVQTYQATGEIDVNITAQSAGYDPHANIAAAWMASGGALRLAAMAEGSDSVFFDLTKEYMKGAVKKRSVEARMEVTNKEALHSLSDEKLAELLMEEET